MAMVLRKRRNEASASTGSSNSRRSKICAESTKMEKKGWYNLEPEVLAIIFEFLEWPERFKLERVSRHWRNAIQSKQFLNVGVVVWEEYSKRWPKLSFDKLIYNLAVVRHKIISGIDIEASFVSRVLNQRVTLEHGQMTNGLGLIRSWDHFKVVRLRDFGNILARFDSLLNGVLRQAFNLEELVLMLPDIRNHNRIKVDLSSFQHLKTVDLTDCFCFPVNLVGDCLTTLSIAGGGEGICIHDFDSITDMLIKCAGTLRTLKMCDISVDGSPIATSRRSILFPRLESLTIDSVQLHGCYLEIDLTEAKLKQLNYADSTGIHLYLSEHVPNAEPHLVNFDEIQNVLSDEIESMNIRLKYSQTIVTIMDKMTGSCYPKLCRLDLQLLELAGNEDEDVISKSEMMIISKSEMDENESESILVSVLGLLDNAENLNYIRLKNVIRIPTQVIRLLIKMKCLKRAFEVNVGTIYKNGASFWSSLVEQLKVDKIIESNNCCKIEVNCEFRSDKVKNVDSIDLLKEKYNMNCVGSGWDDDYSDESDSM